MASSTPGQIILCTGANRSLGFSILQATALRLPSATYLLGSRSLQAGAEAVTELRKLGIKSSIEVLELDVSSDSSIFAAVETVKSKYGRLDVLINNAGIALLPTTLPTIRSTYNTTLSTNLTSIAVLTTALLPLLHAPSSPAHSPKVINVSSARGSLARSSTPGMLPPTAAVAYSISKTALNALTIEFQKAEDARPPPPPPSQSRDGDGSRDGSGGGDGDGKEGGERSIRFWVVSPGHLRTAFNNYRGTKDPLDGAEVVVRLVCEGEEEEGKEGGGEGGGGGGGGGMEGKGRRGGTFWEFEEGEMREVPW